MTDWIDTKQDLPRRSYPARSCHTCANGQASTARKNDEDFAAVACRLNPKVVLKRHGDVCAQWRG